MNKVSLSSSEIQTIKTKVFKAIDSFRGKKVLVVGDIGLDEYIKGEVTRISPEAPVPVLTVNSSERRLGLAANVAQNVTSLGGDCTLVSVVGNDEAGIELESLLKQAKVSTSLVIDQKRPTIKKTRVIHHAHHIVRIDYEKKEYIAATVEDQLLKQFKTHIKNADIVVVEDYNKGSLPETLIQSIISLCKEHKKTVLVDPHETTPLAHYKNADIITPNTKESFALLNISQDAISTNAITPVDLAKQLLTTLNSEKVVITQGKDGMSIFEQGSWVHMPTQAKQVFDVTGAGDTVIASMALGLAAGLNLVESCLLANFAAGIVVAEVGCVTCQPDELKSFLSN